MNIQTKRLASDLKYIVDATLALIEERRHQKAEFKVFCLMPLSSTFSL